MKVLSNLGLICFSILGSNVACATSFNDSEHFDSEINDCSDKTNISPSNWYEENKLINEGKRRQSNSSYKAINILKLSKSQSNISDVSSSPIPMRNLTASESVIFDVAETLENKQLFSKKTEEDDFYLRISDFFEKYKNSEYIVIFECDGITQTIHALNAQKALTNIYWSKSKDLGIWNKVNKWVGISYGCTLAGANDGKLAETTNITEFNNVSDDILNRLKKDRLNKNKWYSGFTNCLFNSCIGCAKLDAENDDIAIIRESQFDQATPDAVQRYIADYFPRYVDNRLVFLQSGKDRRRIDPSYQKSYMSIINMVNETAKANQKNIIRKNFGGASNMVATVVDTTKIPLASKIIAGVGRLIADNIKFKSIDDTEHCDAYREMSDEVSDNGTVKLIINVDNCDGNETAPNLQIEHKPQDNKLKYRLTVNIPYLSYQNKKYDFEVGYYKILDYLNNDNVFPFLAPLFEYIYNKVPFSTTKIEHNKNEI